MPHKIDILNAATFPENERPNINSVRIPQRLTAKNIIQTLDNLGLNVTVLQAMAENSDEQTVRFGYENRPSIHAIEVKKIDAALAKTSLPVSEKIRLKYALDSRGLLKR